MNKYKIISDSPYYLDEELINKNDIDIVSLYISFNNNDYIKEYNNIKVEEIYNFMNNFPDAPIKTSLPSSQDYIDKFTPYLENETDILCICMNSKFSGSYQSALNASSILKESFPNRKIFIIDSCNITGVQGLLVSEAIYLKNNNYSLEENVNKLEEIKNTGFLIFTVDNLKYLQRGGRIGKIKSIAGMLLNIKPIIAYENKELVPVNKIRGRKKSIDYLIKYIIEKYKDNIDEYDIVVLYASCEEESKYIYNTLKEKYNVKYIQKSNIGSVISVHIGPTAIGIGLLKRIKK